MYSKAANSDLDCTDTHIHTHTHTYTKTLKQTHTKAEDIIDTAHGMCVFFQKKFLYEYWCVRIQFKNRIT